VNFFRIKNNYYLHHKTLLPLHMANANPNIPSIQARVQNIQALSLQANPSLQTLGNELTSLSNVPQIQNNPVAQVLVFALQTITRNGRANKLQLQASDRNNNARILNTWVRYSTSQIHQLVHFQTKKSIRNFPTTPNAINKMNSHTITTVLRALGVPHTRIPPRIADKRKLLKVTIGLPSV